MSGFAVLLLQCINIAFEVYFIILFARVLLSWVRINPYGKIYQFIFGMTEPLLLPIRKLFKPSAALPVDFSPMILMLVLFVAERLLAVLVASLL